jgi:hypothetical protein
MADMGAASQASEKRRIAQMDHDAGAATYTESPVERDGIRRD